MSSSISIVIPVFNEEKNIIDVYNHLRKALGISKVLNYEIIFVDDGSLDNSLKIIDDLKKKEKNKIRIIKNKFNKGIGYSIKRGMSEAKKEFVFFLPSDNEHKFSGITPLLKNFYNYDIIIPYVENKNARPKHRRIISILYTVLINFLFYNRIPYYNGLVVYRSIIAKKSLKKINNFSFSFLAELLLRVLRITKNYKIVGYKINYIKVSNSSALKFKNIFYSLYFIILLRVNFWTK